MARVFKFQFIILALSLSSVVAHELDETVLFKDIQFPQRIHVSTQQAKQKVLFQSAESQQAFQPFNTVLFNGTSTNKKWRLEISYLNDDEQWSAWTEAHLRLFESGRFWAKFSLPTGTTEKLRYRIMNDGLQDEFVLQIFAVEVFDNTRKFEERQTTLSKIQNYSEWAYQDSIPKPEVISREQWGAVPPAGTLIPHDPYRMTLHHTAMQRIQTLEDGMAEMRFIQDFHINGRGWKDIGYHFCIDDSGRIYEATPEQFVGTHTGGANTGNIGVSMMGNFDIEEPPAAAIEACINLFSYLACKYQINPDSLMGHRDYGLTACPGRYAYQRLPEIRNRIRQQISYGAPYVTDPFPQPYSSDIETNTNLSFHIRDDEEGVDSSSIRITVNEELISPTRISGDSLDYWVRHRFDSPLEKSKTIVVNIRAADFSSPPESLNYCYHFKTITIDELTEIFSIDSLVNGTLETEGTWNFEEGDVQLSGLTDGTIVWAIDTLHDHRVKIYPNINESGNYQLYTAFGGMGIGINGHYRLTNSNGISNNELVEYNGTYYNKWGRLGNSPIYFEAGSPSSGFIELLPIPGLPSLMVVDAFRFQKQDLFAPPAIPELKYVKMNTEGQLEIAWYPALEGDVEGYRLFQSSDGRSWSDPIADESMLSIDDTSYTMPAPPPMNTYYFRIVAVDSNVIDNEAGFPEPILSEPSDTYGICLKGDTKILIVDNFDRRASWVKGQHFFVRSYGDALSANGVGFESCVNDAVQFGEVTLNDYDVVIYFCGDDSDNDESIAFVDMEKISGFLAAGGKLFITGAEIGYDLARPGRLETVRYNDIFKANYLGDDSGIPACEGAEGTVFEGLTFEYGKVTEDTYVEDWPDYIQPYGGSEVALYYQNSNKVAAIQYTGPFFLDSTITAQLFYLAFAYETIYPAQSRAELMERILTYFNVETDVESRKTASLPATYSLTQNYPNPFNPSTVIKYEIPKSGHVNLRIFNILGQKVLTLVDEKQKAGRYQLHWEGRNTSGDLVSSGVYFYLIEVNDFSSKKKMVLVR